MHARVTRMQMDPARLDDGIRQLESEEQRWRKLDGFRGFTLLVDRETGDIAGTTYWESEDAMKASEEAVSDSRGRVVEAGGASEPPAVERYEVAVDTMA